jgi:hypothetical protein
LLHTAGRQFTTYAAQDFQPRLSLDLFLTARQQFRMSLQWAAINAEEQERWFLPESGDGYLEEVPRLPEQNPRDFVINRMTVQARYRWQIAPLSDLFLVYTRGSNYPSDPEDEIGDMFLDAISNPVVDFFVVKWLQPTSHSRVPGIGITMERRYGQIHSVRTVRVVELSLHRYRQPARFRVLVHPHTTRANGGLLRLAESLGNEGGTELESTQVGDCLCEAALAEG